MPGRGGRFLQLSDKSPPTKTGRGSSVLLERSQSALRNIWSSSLLEKHRVLEALLVLSWDAKPNAPPAGEAGEGSQYKEVRLKRRSRKSEGQPGLPPARAERGATPFRLRNSVPSYSEMGTFKGLNRRQHQLSSRGERQGSRPAGCSAQRATCLRR